VVSGFNVSKYFGARSVGKPPHSSFLTVLLRAFQNVTTYSTIFWSQSKKDNSASFSKQVRAISPRTPVVTDIGEKLQATYSM